MITIDIYNFTQTKIITKQFSELAERARKILIKDKRITSKKDFLIEVSFVGDTKITQLNKQHHKKNRPTDVVSLSYFEADPRDPDTFAGEIFISVPYARRQAAQIKQSLNEELKFLFVHGLLHVFGYDHMKEIEEKHMLDLTYAVLKRK
ncbi:rRNA maturation RNase YbeY [Candidatus Gracilibacteria bacterium]|nr:rRNA maturation RNase YbeY [Candidatus Gracilibacteria bacterium]